MTGLWTEDSDGERWLVNPQLIIANPRPTKRKRRLKKMAARRKRRQPAGLRKYWAARRGRKSTHRRRRAKRNYTSAGMLVNPRRRRRARRSMANPRRRRHAVRRTTRRVRRHYARNPQLLGFTLPDIGDVLFTAAGMVAPPLVTTYVMKNLVPTAYQASRPVYYAVKAAAVVVPSLVVRKFVSPRAGNLMLLGGVASLAIDLIKEFAPGVIPGIGAQPFLGFYESMPQRPSLGRYLGPGGRGAGSNAPSMMVSGAPDRLDPANRF